MNTGQRLDKLLNTSDSGFNHAMQSMIWEHTPDQKFAPDSSIIDYMEILRDIFFFCLDNYKNPYSCIERILTAPKEVNEDEDEDYLLAVIDSILHLIAVSDACDEMIILYTQLIDFRHKLAPWDEDEGVKAIIAEMEAHQHLKSSSTGKKSTQTTHNAEDVGEFTNQPLNNTISNGFTGYILEKYQEKLMPYLLEKYKGQKPESFGYLLYALVDLGLIWPSVLTTNLSKLHRDLTATYGNVGTRENLRKTIERLGRANVVEEMEVKKHVGLLRAFLKID